MGRYRKSFSKAFRTKIFERDNYTCFDCKNVFIYEELTIDHKLELQYGGTNDEYNLQAACDGCNQKKNDEKNRIEGNLRKIMRRRIFKF